MASRALPFLSDEQNDGDPACRWTDFKSPKLRKFPPPLSSLLWREYLGKGEDGIVLRALCDENQVAVKFVRHQSLARYLHGSDAAKFHHSRPPRSVDGMRRSWPLRQECYNGALLQMITASLRRAADSGRPIHVLRDPTTRRDATKNLRAFSVDNADEPDGPDWVPFTLDTQVNKCLGWIEVGKDDILRALRRATRKGEGGQRRAEVFDAVASLEKDQSFFALIYTFVPQGMLDTRSIQSQLDFFHMAGFLVLMFKKDNWRGQGVLVDFSDIVPLHETAWAECDYRRMDIAACIELKVVSLV